MVIGILEERLFAINDRFLMNIVNKIESNIEPYATLEWFLC